MSGDQPKPTVASFGPFEADFKTQEIRKHGVRLRLPGQSFQILRMLLERPGELVTREKLREEIWPSTTVSMLLSIAFVKRWAIPPTIPPLSRLSTGVVTNSSHLSTAPLPRQLKCRVRESLRTP